MDTTNRLTKRRFQTDITSYFNRNCSDTPHHVEKPTTSSPEVPTAIQSSLLNVGMRIRKSVAEGYKTEPLSPLLHGNSFGPHTTSSGYAELVPYCAMIKVGGYEVQPRVSDVLPGLCFAEDESGGSLPSSQESVVELESAVRGSGAPSRAGKRRFAEGMEDERQGGMDDEAVESSMNISVPMALRPIAQARSRRPVIANNKGAYGGDFGEATFPRSLDEGMDFGD